jgi:hypothetical protein
VDNKSSNFFGEQLLTLYGAFDLVICNGVARWANSGNFTCNTYNGTSVVDYAICSHGLCEKIEEVLIGEQLWELKSYHKPIYLTLTWAEQQQHGTKNQHIRQPPSKGRILLTQKNCNTFKIALKRLFNKKKISSQGLYSHELTNLIQSALTECKRAKNRKSETNYFLVNVWFDEECKTTRKTLKELSHKEISIKTYKQIVRKKKTDFMISRREELIFLGKNNPKLFWKELQTKKKQTEK